MLDAGNHIGALDRLRTFIPENQILTDTDLKISRLLLRKIDDISKGEKAAVKEEIPVRLVRGWKNLSVKIRQQQRVRVLFLNDNGFVAGAGIGAARQAQCFLKNGWDVVVMATHHAPDVELAYPSRYGCGEVQFINICESSSPRKRKPRETEAILQEIRKMMPDLVVTGNFHATGIDQGVIDRIADLGISIVVYGHDCDWVTGGCAHYLYQNCEFHKSGCDDELCPKDEKSYPPLYQPVSQAWRRRGELFNRNRVPIFVNSRWMKGVFRERFPKNRNIHAVHLGVDTDVFKPLDKESVRKKFGIDNNKFVVLSGVASFSSERKGGDVLKAVFEHFLGDESVLFVFFGHVRGESLPENVKMLGYLSGEDRLCEAYNTADVFLNPVKIEAFGQTMLEAASCGLPILGLDKTGIRDILHHSVNGYFCNHEDVATFSSAIRALRDNPERRRVLSENSRLIAENLFSHDRQFRGWCDALIDVAYSYAQEDSGRSLEGKKAGPSKISGNARDLLSVVTVTYNVGEEFVRTAESILEQTTEVEWVIVDGKSTNPVSRAILDNYRDLADCFVSEPDNGIYDAMNKAIEMCRGEYVLFLGSGDFLASDDIVEQVMPLVRGHDLFVGNVVEVRISGKAEATHTINPLDRIAKWRDPQDKTPPLRGMPPHQATIIRRSLLQKYMFDDGFNICADWDQIFRICTMEKDVSVGNTDLIVSWYPNGGYSAVRSDLWLQEAHRIVQKYCAPRRKYEDFYTRALRGQYSVISERSEVSRRIGKIASELSGNG